MLGFVGLGNMGGAIVSRLLEQKVSVIAYDSDPNVLLRQARAGATPATSASEVANEADCVMACLPSATVSLEVGREVARGKRTRIYAELSTIGCGAITELAELFRPRGIALVDAPVSGSAHAAEQRTLSVFLAGPAPAINAIETVAAAFCGSITRIGSEPGQAQLCKVVNDAISLTAFLVSCEAITTGVRAGITATTLVNVINAGTGRNSGTTHKIPQAILPRTFNLGGRLGAALKDLDLYLSEAGKVGLPPGVIAETRLLWAKAAGELDPAQDASTIIHYFESKLGVEVTG